MHGVLPQIQQVAAAADGGSPLLVRALGRALGMGTAEQDALARGAVPAWFWMTLGVAAGVIAGARLQRRWPSQLPHWMNGAR